MPITSNEVFDERKQGSIEQALSMAFELIQQDSNDKRNQRALAWCLVDAIKLNIHPQQTTNYLNRLNSLPVSQIDEALQRVLGKLNNPHREAIAQAKLFSQNGEHGKAANIYNNILKKDFENIPIQTSFAWELYRLAKQFLPQAAQHMDKFRRYFSEYFRLQTEKPSQLHSCFLFVAFQIAKSDVINADDNIDFADFCARWDLRHLNVEDYYPKKSEKGEFPSFAFQVFRVALKSGIQKNNKSAVSILVAFIDKNQHRLREDTIWINWDLAKSYRFLGENDLARKKAFTVLKSRPHEYWLWDFIGDTCTDKEYAAACWAKALCLQRDVGFTYKIKHKLALFFVEKEQFSHAKTEIDEIITYKQNNSQYIDQTMINLTQSTWYQSTQANQNNTVYYQNQAKTAEDLLYQDKPWIYGFFGENFDRNNKKMRTLFLLFDDIPTEIRLPENRINLEERTEHLGVKVKGEFDGSRFQLYVLRKCKQEEINDQFLTNFPTKITVVQYINQTNQSVHLLTSEKIMTQVALNDLDFIPKAMDVVEIGLSKHKTRNNKTRYKTHFIKKSDKNPPSSLLKEFCDDVRVSKNMGFGIQEGIFISPELIEKHHIEDDDTVSGIALLNFDRKKNRWGWRAVEILSVEKSDLDDLDYECDDE